MAEFIFQCPNCSSFMTVEESWIGMEVTCPQCQESVTITAPETVTDAVEEPTENKDNISNNIKKTNILAKLSKKQKILFGTAVILLLSGIGWGGWNYITYKNAKELAETKEQRLSELKRAVPVIFHKFIEKHISEFKDIEQTKLFNIPQEWIVL